MPVMMLKVNTEVAGRIASIKRALTRLGAKVRDNFADVTVTDAFVVGRALALYDTFLGLPEDVEIVFRRKDGSEEVIPRNRIL